MTLRPSNTTHDASAWDTELFVLRGDHREELRSHIAEMAQYVETSLHVDLKDLAFTVNSGLTPGGSRLAIVAKSADDLQAKLARAADKLADPKCEKIRDVTGVYYFAEPFHPQGKIAFLFPGEGAQYLHMIGDLLPHFPAVDEVLSYCDEIASQPGMKIPSPRRFICFPNDAPPEEREAAERELRRLGNAMFSVLVADLAIYRLLEEFGLTPDLIAGHSAGELAALMAAGCMSDEYNATGRVIETMQALEDMEDETGVEPAVLLAVGASREKMATLLNEVGSGRRTFVAMDNCPHQTVLVGEREAMGAVEARLQKDGYVYERLSLSRPYHTRLFEPYSAPLAEMLAEIRFQPPARRIYSCTTAAPFPAEADEIRRLTLAHWFSPVEFTRLIRNMHDEGARLFVEVGPRGNLTSFVEDILRGRPFLAVPADTQRRSGVTQLHHLLGQLAAHGVELRFAPLYERREAKRIADWEECGMRNAECGMEDMLDQALSSRRLTASGSPTTPSTPAASRANVVASHLALMDQFLGDQDAVMQQYLAARRSGARPGRSVRRARGQRSSASRPRLEAPRVPNSSSIPHSALRIPHSPPPNPQSCPLPLLGEIVKHDPGQEVVMRRQLDLAEDRFAADHTVGGRMVSKVHPDHYGLPIGPMTFTRELMAETAALLAPDLVAVEVKDVRLFRWLAYYEDAPGEIEVAAKVVGALRAPTTMEVEVRLSIVDNGNLPRGETAGPAAVGRVVLAPSHPAAPDAEPLALTGRRDCRITLEELYHDLFHGPLFTGVTELTAVGDEGIEGRAVVLPRKGLLRSNDDPQFLLDPVLLDVAMHPLCAWHLEQPDRAGRTLLPFELKGVEVFGPRPPEGARFQVRGRILESSPRHFVHAVEAVDETGRVWSRLVAKYWRFYMPHGEINFHGRKDEYFISNQWPEAIEGLARARRGPPDPAGLGHRARHGSPDPAGLGDLRSDEVARSGDRPQREDGPGGPSYGSDGHECPSYGNATRGVCVRLEPPVDLHQPAMQMVTAQVTLSADEMREYRRMSVPPKKRFDWLFGRLAAKDAVRLAWWERHGERFFPADMEVKHDEHGRPFAEHLGYGDQAAMPHVSVSHADGVMAALASFEPHVGIDLEKIEPREASFEALALDEQERRLLDQQGDRAEAVTRFWCAKEAVAKALGRGLSAGPRSVTVRTFDASSGEVQVELGDALAAEFPHFAGQPLLAFTTRYKNFIVATTFCDIDE